MLYNGLTSDTPEDDWKIHSKFDKFGDLTDVVMCDNTTNKGHGFKGHGFDFVKRRGKTWTKSLNGTAFTKPEDDR